MKNKVFACISAPIRGLSQRLIWEITHILYVYYKFHFSWSGINGILHSTVPWIILQAFSSTSWGFLEQ